MCGSASTNPAANTSATRHGRASTIRVSLKSDPEVRVAVEDDGAGFDEGVVRAKGRYGLVSMRDRAAALGAHLTLSSCPGTGTHVEVMLPRTQ